MHEEEELPGVNEQEQEVFDEFEEQAECLQILHSMQSLINNLRI